MEDIPSEIIIEILKRLPVKSLLQFRIVSKTWQQIIDSPEFVSIQLAHSEKRSEKILIHSYSYKKRGHLIYMDNEFQSVEARPNSATVETLRAPPENLGKKRCSSMCSCDGLLLLTFSDETLCLWNPSSGKSRIIPNPGESEAEDVAFGFGYDPSVKDYKILRIRNREHDNEARVFDLKKNTWRSIDMPGGVYVRTQNSVFLRGEIHLLASKSRTTEVLSWNVASAETFSEVPTPFASNLPWLFFMELCVLDGRLCLQLKNHYYMDHLFEIWTRNEYDDGKNWIKIQTIGWASLVSDASLVQSFARIYTVKKGELNVLVGWNNDRVCAADMMANSCKKLFDLSGSCTGAVRYVESLVSPLQMKEIWK